MEIEDIRAVNKLFSGIYPYITQQIMELFGRAEGKVLEIGPFSLGISTELAMKFPRLEITVGDDNPEVLEYFRELLSSYQLERRIRIRKLDKYKLDFDDNTFDLVIFRGALFFWRNMDRILSEMFRVLKPGGLAVAGGGFGRYTPDDLINGIIDESRRLNRRLGKRVLKKGDIEEAVKKAGLSPVAEIDEQRGLWVNLRKR